MAPKAPQKTTLDDNAEIYKHRETISERQKLSEMNFSEKVVYFKNYYLKKLIAALIMGGLIIWILVTVSTPKPDRVLNLAVSNFPFPQEIMDQMQTDLKELFDVKSENVAPYIDTSYDLKNFDYASLQKFTTYVFSGEIDIYIGPESTVQRYAMGESFLPLTDFLPTDLYSKFDKEDFLVCKTRLSEDEIEPSQATGPEGVYGIYLKELALFDVFDAEADPPVLAVVATVKNKENAISYIKYLLNK